MTTVSSLSTITLVRELRDECQRQWGRNHAEYCDISWPHRRGTCSYPPPDVLRTASKWLADLGLHERVDAFGLVHDPADMS